MKVENIKVFKIEEDLYILEAMEKDDHIYFKLSTVGENGKIIRRDWGQNLRNMLRCLISDYEVPSVADRAYRLEGHYFVIRVTEDDTIVDFIYDWQKIVKDKRFESEEGALWWILNHFEV